MEHYLTEFYDMLKLRNLADGTVKSYMSYVRTYLNYVQTHLHKLPEEVTWAELRTFIVWIQLERNLSDRTMNQVISKLHFFTIYVLHKPWDRYQVPSRKFDLYLPFVPTKKEVYTFISTRTDLKQKTMITLMYSAGLRVGEVCHLQYEDINRQRMRIHITHSKSRQDRYALLSTQALELLTHYWFTYNKPKGYLFPKQRDFSKPIDPFYLTRAIKSHEEELGWVHRITCHTFRHAFGTHSYENGMDLLMLKALLGHKSIHTTTIYVSLSDATLSKAISPFDVEEDFPRA